VVAYVAGALLALLLLASIAVLYLTVFRPRLGAPRPKKVAPWAIDPTPAEGATRPSRRRHDGVDGGEYRVRAGEDSGERWDPYDPAASRSARVRAARSQRLARRQAASDSLYVLLGIEPNASDRDIERAYRRRAAEIHPDRFFDDPARRREAEDQLKRLNAAMEVLRDPLRRAKYDATL
jgi:hypothetical protein